MKTLVLALALVTLLAGSAAAQSYYQKETTLYAEFFGWGGEASANFEKLIGGKVGIRAGIGFTGLVFAEGIAVPFGVNYLLGSDRDFLGRLYEVSDALRAEHDLFPRGADGYYEDVDPSMGAVELWGRARDISRKLDAELAPAAVDVLRTAGYESWVNNVGHVAVGGGAEQVE